MALTGRLTGVGIAGMVIPAFIAPGTRPGCMVVMAAITMVSMTDIMQVHTEVPQVWVMCVQSLTARALLSTGIPAAFVLQAHVPVAHQAAHVAN